MKKRDLISIQDLKPSEVLYLMEITKKLKESRNRYHDHLEGKSIGLIFQKPSNRTRVSFEVGVAQLGGKCIYLGPTEINLGVRETVEDVSKTLSRYLDGIVARTFSNKDLIDMTKAATIPVINGLSDLYHPCQGLTDIFSIIEHFDQASGLNVAYIGDGNNVCHSLMLGCAMVGMNIRIATPKRYEPDVNVVKSAQAYAKDSGAQIMITNDPNAAAENADVIYSDVWVSMGQEEESQKRLADFQGFQINKKLVSLAKKEYIFMHCLPAHRGQEVTAEVIDSKSSIIFEQAENRLHTQKSILIFLIGNIGE